MFNIYQMRARLVKFEEDGTACKRDIGYLKRHPECGVLFIQDKPFVPINPKISYRPIDRNFDINVIGNIPIDPNIPSPPDFGKPPKIGEAVGQGAYISEYLSQDYTNYQQAGRRLIGEHLEYNRSNPYSRVTNYAETDLQFPVPRIGNDSYTHETRERPTRPVGEIELQDFGEGVGNITETPPTIRQTRIRPIADPRDSEFIRPTGMTDEELIDTQIEQLTRNSTQEEAKLIESQIKAQTRRITLPKRRVPVPDIEGTELIAIEPEKEETLIVREAERFTRQGRPQISQREAEQIAEAFQAKGIDRVRTLQILEEYGLYDTEGEFELQSIADPQERAMIRRLKAINETPTRDTNLIPERQPTVNVSEDTPLTGRRGSVEKAYDKVAGKLPEELRTLASSVKRNTQEFNENLRTRSLEAIQTIRSTTTRTFGQNYESITGRALAETEMTAINAPEGNINIRPATTEDITGIRPNDLQALDFDPLGADYQETFTASTGAKPTLEFNERIQRVRAGALSSEAATGGAGAVGGVLIGFGVAEAMGQAGVDNKFAIAASAGGAGGAGARILTMAGSRALTRGATTAVAETAGAAATRTAIQGGTSLLRGAAEGAVIGIALMPVDMLLNDYFVNSGMNHTESNLASGAAVGALATATTTIGLVSIGAAPETLGASLVVGGLAMAATSLIGFFTGQDQDRKEREARQKAKKAQKRLNQTAKAREELLESLPDFDYDFDKALEAFDDQKGLGQKDDTWNDFSTNTRNMFSRNPTNNPATPTDKKHSGERKKINNLFSQYITHELINRVCADGEGCEELRRQDQGELSKSEIKFLNKHTGSTWRAQANMQVEMSVQELNYTRQRIQAAQTDMLNAWSEDGLVASQLDPYIVQTAGLDPNFMQQYELALKLDAQQQIVDAYQTNQTRMEQLPKNIRDMANLDPEFDNMIHMYYTSIETTAGQLDISVPQLIELQSLSGDKQKDKYQEMQFDNIKQNEIIVDEAQEIAQEEDTVREAGFYDIDQAYLETDPTAITTWKPTDSQILQAHSAGMNLNEYVEYMHQLAMGEAGDYNKIPKYSDAELRASGLLDYSHFQDEIQMAGYRKDLYLYDPETRQFTLNPNITNSAIPSTQSTFIPKYTPRYLLEARSEYADMVHGLNEKNQNEVDNYNGLLMKQLSSYGNEYDSIVANINDARLYEGRTDLLYYDIGKIYNNNRIEFTPLSENINNPISQNITNQNEATRRQLNPQTRAERKAQAAANYGLSSSQYDTVKGNLDAKGLLKDATEQQIIQEADNVKASTPASSTPAATTND